MKKHKSKPAKPAEPFLSKTPWRGFARGDVARQQELPVCPDARCRRAKACLAAHGGLFCQRTHLSRRERKRAAVEEQRAFDRRFPPIAPDLPFELHKMRIEALLEDRKVRDAAMTARWKAGVFDHLYGKWRARGALMQPPVKVYKEEGR